MAVDPIARFEIPRRQILFRPDTAMPDGSVFGYDADPNLAVPTNSDAEYLLHYCPIGTLYTQSGIIWRKIEDTPGGLWQAAFAYPNFVHLDWEDITEIDSATFQVPDNYLSGTLVVYRNGQKLEKAPLNGYTESAVNQFTLKLPKKNGERISVTYMKP